MFCLYVCNLYMRLYGVKVCAIALNDFAEQILLA